MDSVLNDFKIKYEGPMKFFNCYVTTNRLPVLLMIRFNVSGQNTLR